MFTGGRVNVKLYYNAYILENYHNMYNTERKK